LAYIYNYKYRFLQTTGKELFLLAALGCNRDDGKEEKKLTIRRIQVSEEPYTEGGKKKPSDLVSAKEVQDIGGKGGKCEVAPTIRTWDIISLREKIMPSSGKGVNWKS